MKTFYITTPIYYPSGKPHIGTCYTNILADIIARWHRQKGEEVFFTTGTDEHTQKVEKTAKEKNITPQKFVDEIAEIFKEVFKTYNISYDKFVRTSDKSHKDFCTKILNEVYKNGDIYKGKYEGWYCVSCETYYTEKDLIDNKCPIHKREVSWLEEENYFFKMSKYEKQVYDYIKKQNYIFPKERQEFILNRIQREGVKDLCISRKNTGWGIPLPFDNHFVNWVWFDALLNYPSNVNTTKLKKFWPADVHLTAHDIMWHHSIVWLSILAATKQKFPKKLLVHGFIQGEGGVKMSKSLGNVVDPIELSQEFTIDSIRYFLVREIPTGLDGSFSKKALIERHNSELVNDLSNLHNRTLSMIEKYFPNKVSKSTKNLLLKKLNFKAIDSFINSYQLNIALSEIWKFINECNKFISDTKPWEIKDNPKKLEYLMYNLLESLRVIAILLEPFMPSTSGKIFFSLGLKTQNFKQIKFGLVANYKIKKQEFLFTRIEDGNKMQNKEIIPQKESLVKYEDFAKLDLRVAKIIKVENHPNADKLYVLQLSLGNEQKQIVAGIRSYYKPEQLLNKKIIIINNLQPTVLRGVESNGMLLAASKDQKVVFLTPESDIPEGAKIS